jgi:hypothetical protein
LSRNKSDSVLQLAIKGVPHSSSKNTETTPHFGCCVLLYSLHESLRAQNSREQDSKTSSSCDTCTGRRAIKVFGERNSTRLLACMNDYFLVVRASVRLLPSGVHSSTTTVKRTFMGRHCFHSFCIKLDRLLQTAQHVDCWERHHRCLRHWSCLWVQP